MNADQKRKLDKLSNGDLLWLLIEKLEWTKDHDYKRINRKLQDLRKPAYDAFKQFVNIRHYELHDKFGNAWLGKDGGKGFDCSDDGWNDLRAEVVGRGKLFYETITEEKLREMARECDYHESFLYIFN